MVLLHYGVAVIVKVDMLLKDLQRSMNLTYIFISHDLSVVKFISDKIGVMYLGTMVEFGNKDDIFSNPLHPYTIGLQASKPLITSDANEPLYSIPGQVPNPINLPNTCFFKNRCNKCIGKCNGEYPKEIKVSDTHYVSCYLYEEGEE